ncbi:MAG: hypothetical protein WED85_09615 [Dehalococcoidia bacterium]
MRSAVREQIDQAPVGTWFRPSELGGGNATEQLLSRLARESAGPVVRAAKGLYFKSGPPDPFFGKRRPSPLQTACQVARGRGVGPAGAAAAAYLGLTTQVAPRPSLTVVGAPPTGVGGVDWQVRNNPVRAQLNFVEVAVIELLSLYPYGVEAEWDEVVARVAELRARRTINLERISEAVDAERRKPALRENLRRLLVDLAAA